MGSMSGEWGTEMRYAILILVALAAGCSKPMVWTKPDAEPNELYKDKAECAAQGGQASKYPKHQRTVYALCMRGRGWEEVK